jgi:hypothetical protein
MKQEQSSSLDIIPSKNWVKQMILMITKSRLGKNVVEANFFQAGAG